MSQGQDQQEYCQRLTVNGGSVPGTGRTLARALLWPVPTPSSAHGQASRDHRSNKNILIEAISGLLLLLLAPSSAGSRTVR